MGGSLWCRERQVLMGRWHNRRAFQPHCYLFRERLAKEVAVVAVAVVAGDLA